MFSAKSSAAERGVAISTTTPTPADDMITRGQRIFDVAARQARSLMETLTPQLLK